MQGRLWTPVLYNGTHVAGRGQARWVKRQTESASAHELLVTASPACHYSRFPDLQHHMSMAA